MGNLLFLGTPSFLGNLFLSVHPFFSGNLILREKKCFDGGGAGAHDAGDRTGPYHSQQAGETYARLGGFLYHVSVLLLVGRVRSTLICSICQHFLRHLLRGAIPTS